MIFNTKDGLDMDGLFCQELAALINKHGLESGSNVPDFILAEHLCGCLIQFNSTQRKVEMVRGKNIK